MGSSSSLRSSSFILGDDIESKNKNGISVTFQSDSSNNVYKGSSTTFYNLLSPSDLSKEENANDKSNDNDNDDFVTTILNNDQLLKGINPFIPRQLIQTVFD